MYICIYHGVMCIESPYQRNRGHLLFCLLLDRRMKGTKLGFQKLSWNNADRCLTDRERYPCLRQSCYPESMTLSSALTCVVVAAAAAAAAISHCFGPCFCFISFFLFFFLYSVLPRAWLLMRSSRAVLEVTTSDVDSGGRSIHVMPLNCTSTDAWVKVQRSGKSTDSTTFLGESADRNYSSLSHTHTICDYENPSVNFAKIKKLTYFLFF